MTSAVLCVIARIYVIQSIAGQDTLQLCIHRVSQKAFLRISLYYVLCIFPVHGIFFGWTYLAAAVEVQNRV